MWTKAAIATLALVLPTPAARATLVTGNFSGYVSNVNSTAPAGLTRDAPLTGTFSYDTADAQPTGQPGFFAFQTGATLSTTADGVTLSAAAGPDHVFFITALPGLFQIRYTSFTYDGSSLTDPLRYAQRLSILCNFGTCLPDTDLPTGSFPLVDADEPFGWWDDLRVDNIAIEFFVTALTITPVAEPRSIALLALGLAGAGLARRRALRGETGLAAPDHPAGVGLAQPAAWRRLTE